MSEFVAVMTDDATALYELGDDGGVIFFTDIIPPATTLSGIEPRASGHALIWDRALLGHADVATEVCIHAMRHWELHRLIAEVPAANRLACAYAQRAGFQPLGRLRQRLYVHKRWRDAIVYDALEGDLMEARRRHGDGRHRRLRLEVGQQERTEGLKETARSH